MKASLSKSSTTTSRILVPHDGSEMSDKALEKAIEFSKSFKSEIIILHVVDDGLIPSSAILGFISEKSTFEDAKIQTLKILRMGAEAMLRERMEKTREYGINIRFIIGTGPPAEGIANVARSEDVDLIIMGSRELGREKEFGTDKLKLLVSVAYNQIFIFYANLLVLISKPRAHKIILFRSFILFLRRYPIIR